MNIFQISAFLITTRCSPAADFPNHWDGFIQLLHIDVKIPSEHTICGRRYDGEMVLWFWHPARKKSINMAFMIKIGKRNEEFQKAVDAWQNEFDLMALKCNRRKGRKLNRKFSSQIDSTSLNIVNFTSATALNRRRHKGSLDSTIFNPFHPTIVRTDYFYGYWGSLTEPPCTQVVSWRIMDKPFHISQGQMNQIKDILFNQVNSDCKRSSVHHDGSIARPLQIFSTKTVSRELWRCTEKNWYP